MNELVDSVINSKLYNPINFFENWSEIYGMDVSSFIRLLYEKADLFEGINVGIGTGLLPDIWEHCDEEMKIQILDMLVINCEEIDEVEDGKQKLHFLEDLHVVELELREFIGDEDKYDIILEKMDNFTPEQPPKNFMEAQKRQAALLQQESSASK